MTSTRIKFRDIRTFRNLREWYNQPFIIRIKAIFWTVVISVGIVLANQYQVQYINCSARIDGRNDLRTVLFRMVDLSDLFPGDETGERYTANRQDFINENFQMLTRRECMGWWG